MSRAIRNVAKAALARSHTLSSQLININGVTRNP
jgi:hypothetical protein